MMENQNAAFAELQRLFRENPPRKPTPEEIEKQRISFEKMMDRVSRRGGISLPTENAYKTIILPPQAGLEDFMRDSVTQINTYEISDTLNCYGWSS